MNKSVILGAGLGVAVLLLGGSVLMFRSGSYDERLPLTPAAVSPRSPGLTGVGQDAALTGAGAPEAGDARWHAAGDGAVPTRPPVSGAANTPVNMGRAGAPAIGDIQKRLQQIAASGHPDLRELDGVLADLQRNQGSAVVGGVNLQVVRDNLARTERIQQLAQQMQVLAANPTAETPARLQALMTEMQRTQSQMQALGAISQRGAP